MNVFIEVGAGLPEAYYPNTKFRFTRKKFIEPQDIQSMIARYRGIDVYQTMMHYLNPIWITTPKGKAIIDAEMSYKASDFYLDFDKPISSEEDYKLLKQDVEVAIRYFTIILKIPSDQIRVYFSGSKGIHLTIPMLTLGLEPSISLHKLYREIAMDINRYIMYETLDTAIYDNKRLFRIANTFNSKGERYKIPISLKEFRSLTYEALRELAKEPRWIELSPNALSEPTRNILKSKMKMWEDKGDKSKEFSGKILNVKELPPCIKHMHERMFIETVDERNNSGTALASFYFQKGMPHDEAKALLHEWGSKNCEPPLNEGSIDTIIESVYTGAYRYGCATFERLSGICDKENCPLFAKKQTNQKGK